MKPLFAAIAMLALPLPALAQDADASVEEQSVERLPDVIYVPTPAAVVDHMLVMAEVGPDDILYDLGSGDGRIPIAAAKAHGIRAVGIDIDPERVREARANAEAAGVEDLVTFHQADLFTSDFSEATVVTLYLLDSLNEKLRPKLLSELEPGTRIVSHAFRMGDWEPEESAIVDSRHVFLWRVPEGGETAIERSASD